jgi:hypothetical protein
MPAAPAKSRVVCSLSRRSRFRSLVVHLTTDPGWAGRLGERGQQRVQTLCPIWLPEPLPS